MKWEIVKKNVISGVRTEILRDWEHSTKITLDLIACNFETKKGKSRSEVLEIYADKAADIINNWDIRGTERLRHLFPKYFPKSLKGKLIADYDEQGDWAIYTK